MNEKIILGHGSGGRMTRDLVRDVFCRHLGDFGPQSMDDGAVLPCEKGELVFTTDSYVVSPLEFPGGDIGTLAVCGTVNDLAVMGARPLWLSLGVILEAGLEIDALERIVKSIAAKAREAGVKIVCGDTKVVEKGKGDGIFINTAGIGVLEHPLTPETIEPGDQIIVSGTVGDHGMALLTLRKGFPLKSDLKSDCAPLNGMISQCLDEAGVKWMRDATRGGVATILNELSEGRPWGVLLEENDIPLSDAVAGVSELLGLDPLYSANEGKVIFVVPRHQAENALKGLKKSAYGKKAAVIGLIVDDFPGKTVLHTQMGTLRTLGILASDPLPRIC
ncbi:hydrogenase expression/formation protein HypE [Pontiella sulfatireligans]|uniref:Hydrogenase isoenzymes formation protein HypE n=1 Tax=Pontiella sulfatireligans TaxID=2750658 RepID=A0A6C2UNE3_9BACT|nr:hydrogenase expression/formation protein HypE [Pontiella sulfatireligans]VGO20566.1 Hydrogenase isoenzymes formation protein HypE [Pontiella sulfatireligans]